MGRTITQERLETGDFTDVTPEEEALGNHHHVSVSSMALVSPDGNAAVQIFYKRNSCCLRTIKALRTGASQETADSRWTDSGRGTSSETAVERSVSIGIPRTLMELLDSDPENDGLLWKMVHLILCTNV